MKILVLTGCDANMASVGDLTAPNIAWYARRHGYHFERVTRYLPGTHPSWQKIRLIQERLPHYDAILWIDADAVVTNPNMLVEEILGTHRGLVVSTDWTYPAPEDAIKHFSLGNFIVRNCPESFRILELAAARTEWANAPLWEQQAIQEEYRANPEIRPWVQVLPRRALNAVPATPATNGPEPWQRGDFICHYTYLANEERRRLIPEAIVEGFRALIGVLPDSWDPGMSMDARHICILRDILLAGCRVMGNWSAGIRHTLEIGVWKGACSSVFVQFKQAGFIDAVSFCDVGFTDEWRDVVSPIMGENTNILHCRGVEALRGPEHYDLILVDGDHSLETGIEETRELLRRQPRIILAHDVRSHYVGYDDCEGPAYMLEALEQDGWTVFVDDLDRATENTKRGFMAATKDPDLASMIRLIFAEYLPSIAAPIVKRRPTRLAKN